MKSRAKGMKPQSKSKETNPAVVYSNTYFFPLKHYSQIVCSYTADIPGTICNIWAVKQPVTVAFP